MTQPRERHAPRARMPRAREAIFYALLLFLFAMLLRNSEEAVESVKTGLLLCARSAIPSLFPFMVLSELLMESGLGTLLGKALGKPLARLLSLPPEGCCSLLMGLGCGFPVGVRSALTLYDNGVLSKRQLERLLCFCNVPSSAFLINAVGFSLYGNRRFGILLYVACVIGSVVIGITLGRRAETDPAPKFTPAHERKTLCVSTFTRAVSSATGAMLSVCAYILFFSSVIGCLSHALDPLSLPAEAKALVYGSLEMTSGTAAASLLESPETSAILCAFLVGFGGLSIHFQLLSFCEGRGLNLAPCLIAKLALGGLCAATVATILALSSDLIQKGESISAFSYTYFSDNYTSICLVCFIACILLLTISLVKRARKRS